jgi:hypothetical protein
MSFALLLEPWSERIRSFERKRRAHTSFARIWENFLNNRNWGNDLANPQMEALHIFFNGKSEEMVLFLSQKNGGKLG